MQKAKQIDIITVFRTVKSKKELRAEQTAVRAKEGSELNRPLTVLNSILS